MPKFTYLRKLKSRRFYTNLSRLKQILNNLLFNAIKFTKDRGSVEFGYKPKDSDTLPLYLEDTGIGIPADKTREILKREGKFCIFAIQ